MIPTTPGRKGDLTNRTFITASDCADALGWETSTTCTSIWASAISSRVALKAAISWVGSFWINPTVSVNRTCRKPNWNYRKASASDLAIMYHVTVNKKGTSSLSFSFCKLAYKKADCPHSTLLASDGKIYHNIYYDDKIKLCKPLYLSARGKADTSSGGIQSCKKDVSCHHIWIRQAVEQSGFACIGIQSATCICPCTCLFFVDLIWWPAGYLQRLYVPSESIQALFVQSTLAIIRSFRRDWSVLCHSRSEAYSRSVCVPNVEIWRLLSQSADQLLECLSGCDLDFTRKRTAIQHSSRSLLVHCSFQTVTVGHQASKARGDLPAPANVPLGSFIDKINILPR